MVELVGGVCDHDKELTYFISTTHQRLEKNGREQTPVRDNHLARQSVGPLINR